MIDPELAAPWLWLVSALMFYGWMVYAVWVAFRPEPGPGEWLPTSDWFYEGGTWTRSDEPGVVYGQYESFKPEPSDQPESKPESEAG